VGRNPGRGVSSSIAIEIEIGIEIVVHPEIIPSSTSLGERSCVSPEWLPIPWNVDFDSDPDFDFDGDNSGTGVLLPPRRGNLHQGLYQATDTTGAVPFVFPHHLITSTPVLSGEGREGGGLPPRQKAS